MTELSSGHRALSLNFHAPLLFPSALLAPLASLSIHLAVGVNTVKFQNCFSDLKTWKIQTACLVPPVVSRYNLMEPWVYQCQL